MVIALAEMLRRRGWAPDVLSRGLTAAKVEGVERVEPDADMAARRFGDEPALLARRLRVPVWVGADRFSAGCAAEVAAGVLVRGVHLLDDGFQHRQLARTLDVVLVTQEDLNDALLPAGNRRERLAALRRADVIVLREDERERIEEQVRGLVRAEAAIWTVRRTVEIPESPDSTEGSPVGAW